MARNIVYLLEQLLVEIRVEGKYMGWNRRGVMLGKEIIVIIAKRIQSVFLDSVLLALRIYWCIPFCDTFLFNHFNYRKGFYSHLIPIHYPTVPILPLCTLHSPPLYLPLSPLSSPLLPFAPFSHYAYLSRVLVVTFLTMSTETVPQDQTTNQPQPTTFYERISQSSHPVCLVCYMFFRGAPLFIYLFGNLFIGFITKQNQFIFLFITVILLVCADFWNLKNIGGRLLVGLRWWNETIPIENQPGEFENVWVFELADPTRYINPIDSYMFWLLLYVVPVVWGVFAFLALVRFEFLYLILVVVAISLSCTNAMAFTKCDKFGKANLVANDVVGSMFSRVGGNVLGRFWGSSLT